MSDQSHVNHSHVHGSGCGHTAVRHQAHVDSPVTSTTSSVTICTTPTAVTATTTALCGSPDRRRATRTPTRGIGAVVLLLGWGLACADVPRGGSSRPAVPRELPIAVLPFRDETGSSLRRPPPKFMRDVPGPLDDPYAGVPPQAASLLLQQRAAAELARRGYAVVPPDQVAAALPQPPEDALAATRAARQAGFEGPILTGTIRRLHVTETGLLQVWLDLALIDPETARVLWSASARRPAKVFPAQTWQEILLDAGGPIFADAFGDL